MKTPLLIALVWSVASVASQAESPPAPAAPDPSPPPPALRARIYDIAGALGNEGFKTRDDAWTGTLEESKALRLAVNLFAGNQYWFAAATSASGETPSLTLRGPDGRPVKTIAYDAAGVAAIGVTAPSTGLFTMEIKGNAAGSRHFCLLYFFK